MPRTSGVFSLLPSYKATSGQSIRVEQHNPPLEDIAQAITQSLPRDGTAPMSGNLPMGNKRITGLKAGVDSSDAPRMDQVTRYSARLEAMGAVAVSANKIIYATGSATFSTASFTAFARQLLDDSNAANARTTLELGGLATQNILNENNLATASTARPPSQSSVKAYVDSQPLAKTYQSPEQPFANGSFYSVNHGLGNIPRLVSVILKCVIAEHGFSANDQVCAPMPAFEDRNIVHSSTATAVTIRVGTDGISLLNASGTRVTITNANWRIIVRAWF